MSRIASVCLSVNLYFVFSPFAASVLDFAARINFTTASMFDCAISRPSTIWSLFSAFAKSNSLVFRITTCLCLMYTLIYSRRVKSLGTRLTSANIFALKLVRSCVFLYILLSVNFGSLIFLSSTTIRTFPFVDSSRRSATSGNFLSRTSIAICSTRFDLFTW